MAAEEERDLLQTQLDNLWVALKLVHAAAMDEYGYDPEAGLQESVQDFLDNNFGRVYLKIVHCWNLSQKVSLLQFYSF